jgi:hypothetical protein
MRFISGKTISSRWIMRYKFGDLIQIKYLYEPVVFVRYASDDAAVVIRESAVKSYIELSNIIGLWGENARNTVVDREVEV